MKQTLKEVMFDMLPVVLLLTGAAASMKLAYDHIVNGIEAGGAVAVYCFLVAFFLCLAFFEFRESVWPKMKAWWRYRHRRI